jgi:putative transcription antitermination factor YqgF
MRYLGVDPGGQRIGLAIGDDVTGIVTPLTVVSYHGVTAAADEIARVAREHESRRVVVGLPVLANGEETPACRRSRHLARELERLGFEVVLQHEFLSSDEARRRARETGIRARQPIDHIAAQVLLEEYLAG